MKKLLHRYCYWLCLQYHQYHCLDFTSNSSQSRGLSSDNSSDTSFREEKMFSAATLEDDFSDDSILIMLNKQETMRFKNYSSRDFSELYESGKTGVLARIVI